MAPERVALHGTMRALSTQDRFVVAGMIERLEPGGYRRRDDAECGLGAIAALHGLTLAGLSADRLVLLHSGAVLLDGSARRDPIEGTGKKLWDRLAHWHVDGFDGVVPGHRDTRR